MKTLAMLAYDEAPVGDFTDANPSYTDAQHTTQVEDTPRELYTMAMIPASEVPAVVDPETDITEELHVIEGLGQLETHLQPQEDQGLSPEASEMLLVATESLGAQLGMPNLVRLPSLENFTGHHTKVACVRIARESIGEALGTLLEKIRTAFKAGFEKFMEVLRWVRDKFRSKQKAQKAQEMNEAAQKAQKSNPAQPLRVEDAGLAQKLCLPGRHSKVDARMLEEVLSNARTAIHALDRAIYPEIDDVVQAFVKETGGLHMLVKSGVGMDFEAKYQSHFKVMEDEYGALGQTLTRFSSSYAGPLDQFLTPEIDQEGLKAMGLSLKSNVGCLGPFDNRTVVLFYVDPRPNQLGKIKTATYTLPVELASEVIELQGPDEFRDLVNLSMAVGSDYAHFLDISERRLKGFYDLIDRLLLRYKDLTAAMLSMKDGKTLNTSQLRAQGIQWLESFKAIGQVTGSYSVNRIWHVLYCMDMLLQRLKEQLVPATAEA
jgi:hypothetical protein